MVENTRLVFVPGFMQRGDAWRPVAEVLPERYPSALLDHSAHDYEGRLGEIAAAGESAIVAGYSLGGRLALRAVLRDPGRFAGIVMVGASAGIDSAPERADRLERDTRLANWLEGAPIEDVVSVWERQPIFADQSDTLVEAQRPGRLSHDPRELAALLRSAGQGVLEPVWEELASLELPLLAVAGARDRRYAEAAERLAAAAPRGRTALVEHAGHAPHLERPEAVVELLVQFVDDHVG